MPYPVAGPLKARHVVIVDDVMYQGAENGKWFAIELNRGYDADGNVTGIEHAMAAGWPTLAMAPGSRVVSRPVTDGLNEACRLVQQFQDQVRHVDVWHLGAGADVVDAANFPFV